MMVLQWENPYFGIYYSIAQWATVPIKCNVALARKCAFVRAGIVAN